MLKNVASKLPRGLSLSQEVWASRHRFMVRVALLHIPFLFAVGLITGEEAVHVFLEVGLVGALVAIGQTRKTEFARSMFISLALLSSSGLLVHFTNGLIESHFHFFVALPLVALYQDWRPFLTAIVYVAFHHGIVGYISPTEVYNHPAAIADPIKWALIHALYVLALVAVLIFYWNFAERSQLALENSRASLQRANRMLRAVTACNDAVIRATNEAELLGEVCRIVVETGDYKMAWVGYADEKTGTIEPVAVGGFDEGYIAGLRLRWSEDGPGQGPSGRAVHMREPVVVPDIVSDPAFAVARSEALKRGYRSLVTVPLVHDQDLWGVLAVYSGESGAFDAEGVKTLQRFADDLAYGIAALRTRELQRAAEDRLRQTVQSKDDLIATIAHELRTPLTAVIGFADVLLDRARSLSPDELDDVIQVIADEGMDLSYIVDDLLVAAKTEAGTLQLIRVRVDLRAQTAQVLERWAPAAISHVEFVGEPAYAMGDPARVRQIIRNLITNALRYGGERVRVEAVTRSESATVSVKDDGPGVSPDEQDSIFQPYQRSKAAPGMTASMGLGLTISRQLARLMGGDLTYRREAGETVFELTLPMADTGRNESSYDAEHQNSSDGPSGQRISDVEAARATSAASAN